MPTLALKGDEEMKKFGEKVSKVIAQSTGKNRYPTFFMEVGKEI